MRSARRCGPIQATPPALARRSAFGMTAPTGIRMELKPPMSKPSRKRSPNGKPSSQLPSPPKPTPGQPPPQTPLIVDVSDDVALRLGRLEVENMQLKAALQQPLGQIREARKTEVLAFQ